MNLFEIWARKRSRQVSELAASSFLNYLLDPEEDHGMGRWFTNKFLSDTGVFPGGLPEMAMVTVYPECSLGRTIGRIDGLVSINIDGKTHLVGIEVKIHDSSSTNFSSEGIPQLSRYYEALRDTASEIVYPFMTGNLEDITIIYVVPGVAQKWPEMVLKCIENDGERPEMLKRHLRIVPWKAIDRYGQYNRLIARHPDLEPRTTISEMFGGLLLSSIKTDHPLLDPYVLHFVHSLRVVAERDFLARKPADGPHATQKAYVEALKGKNQLEVFTALRKAIDRPLKLQPQHTCIGVPYSISRKESVFRIRTVTKYGKGFDTVDRVELEFKKGLWDMPAVAQDIRDAFSQGPYVEIDVRDDKHADRQGKRDVIVVSIMKSQSDWTIDEKERAREAFKQIYNKLNLSAQLPETEASEE